MSYTPAWITELELTDKVIGSDTTLSRFISLSMGRKIVFVGMMIILVMIVLTIFAPWIAPHDPYKQDLSLSLRPPSSEYLLGTDKFGRDSLSRLIFGTRIAMFVGIVAVSIAASIGILLGLISGYYGRWIDQVTMRITDALMSLPTVVMALALAYLFGGGISNVMLAVGIAFSPLFIRVTRSQVLLLRETDYVTAARVIGASNLRIMFFHILPNTIPILIVLCTLQIGTAIILEASLSFLGVGIKPPGAAWGYDLRLAYEVIFRYPILSVVPGICITAAVLSFNLVGDAVRDALDPRLKGVLR